MDDEAKQMLREILDLLRKADERDSAWIEEMRTSTARATRFGKTAWYISYFMYAVVILLVGWLMFTYYST